MALGTPPLKAPLSDIQQDQSSPWAQWFTAIFRICFAVQESGTTAQRPTKNLWTGRPYFDTTLGLPIFYNGTSWIKADGTAA